MLSLSYSSFNIVTHVETCFPHFWSREERRHFLSLSHSHSLNFFYVFKIDPSRNGVLLCLHFSRVQTSVDLRLSNVIVLVTSV